MLILFIILFIFSKTGPRLIDIEDWSFVPACFNYLKPSKGQLLS